MFGLPDDRSIDDQYGPPVLLKRLGNPLEANLARARLEAAGIPSFVAAPDAFGERSSPVGLFVPERCVAEALDALDRPSLDDDAAAYAAFDDPGRPIAFRAFVASVCGWAIVFLTVIGLALAAMAFAYAIVLAVRALRVSTHRDRGLRLQVVASIGLSALGLAMAAALGLYLASTR